jgi:hypothetical protein
MGQLQNWRDLPNGDQLMYFDSRAACELFRNLKAAIASPSAGEQSNNIFRWRAANCDGFDQFGARRRHGRSLQELTKQRS